MKKLLPDRKKQKPQIIVTNLIDIILLLVFFFMITSSFARNNEKLPVNVPKASTAQTLESENFTIQITKEGKAFIAGKTVTEKELGQQVADWVTRSPDRPVLVEADQEANYGKIVSVLDLIRKAGAANVGLATKPDVK
ncbi:MAG: biopolymer transporter ExbD [Candidatus Rifleibacteriota bacterium]